MRRQTPEVPGGLLVVLLVLQIGLALVLAEFYLSMHHTLRNNGDWTVTKTTVSRGLMGAYSFLYSLQPLAGGDLKLAAWHGHHEVVLTEELDPTVIEFDFTLAKGGYLVFEFNRVGKRYDGIRVSRNPSFPPMIAKVSSEGGFLRKQPFPGLRTARSEGWHTLKLEFVEAETAISLDGNLLRRARISSKGAQRIGFRSGAKRTFVDNIRVVSRDGSVFRDTFDYPRNALRVVVSGVVSVLLVSTLLFLLLRRFLAVGDKVLLFSFLMFTMVLLVIAGALHGFASHRKQFYPDADEQLREDERYWRGEFAEQIFAAIEADYSQQPAEGVHRLLFVGASQTWGSGAEARDTWVRRTERLLNKRAVSGRFEAINMAVGAQRMEDMTREFLARGLALKPATVIVNASNNDLGAERTVFVSELDRLVRVGAEAGCRVVLVMEPNSLERKPNSLLELHAIMAEVGERHGVPVIDMHTYLAERYDDGFLWWDWVHLTSYGQRLFAEKLVEELEDIGIVELETMPTRPTRSK